ncbi:hypothetical protein J2741_001251 [Methanolinea mesophila]|uniref:hypothetical protein n=1 Tax=Methanolinea mesophila TaxID=547055 RepID=UPI001AE7B936|nr:hypothetical protein [Methanolinea mesophila]MBP1928704.1 hypothetical protein [Methanolinea mesophila]
MRACRNLWYPALIIISLALLLSGCTNAPENPVPEGTGFSVVPTAVYVQYRSLAEALNALDESISLQSNSAMLYRIYYIEGDNVSSDGKAEQWILGVAQEGDRYFFVHNQGGSSITPWRAWLPSQEIVLDQVISPAALIQGSTLLYTVRINSLILTDGVYTLTYPDQDGTIVTVRFDAKSGKQL